MRKDTEKEDELKSMQTAWETQQPGRLKKVSYIKSYSVLSSMSYSVSKSIAKIATSSELCALFV